MTEDLTARVLNSAGACVAWYNAEEFGDACESIVARDRVELYESGEWRETLTGAEFVELYGK